MKKALFVWLAALLMLLNGCASYVQTRSTPFHGDAHLLRGTVSVAPIDKAQMGSLEFKVIAEYLAKKLVEAGYFPAKSSQSDFVAYVTYGIDNGQTTMTSVPLMGQTGGGSSTTTGSVTSGSRMGSYSSTTTSMPTYGLIGVMPVSSTEYKRVVNIDIFKTPPNKPPEKVYEVKGVSSGSCGNINSVLFSIIDGIFKNFPGESGKTKVINTSWEGPC